MFTKRTKHWTITLLALATLGSVASFGIFAAFTATTSSSGNEVQSGSVALGTNSAGSALFFMSNAKPGDTQTRCIDVSYTGSVIANVALYSATASLGALAPYVNLTITQGTQASPTFPSCTGFTPTLDATYPTGTLYTGTLASFAAAVNTDATGVVTTPQGSSNAWDSGDSVVYRVQVTLDASAPTSAESQTTGPVTLVWQAVNA